MDDSKLPAELGAGNKAVLGLRPQAMHLTEEGGSLSGAVLITERLDAETVVEVGLDGGRHIIMVEPMDRILAPGTPVQIGFDSKDGYLFPPDAD